MNDLILAVTLLLLAGVYAFRLVKNQCSLLLNRTAYKACEVELMKPGNVLMLSAEDGLGDTLRPRLDAVDADVSRIFALNEPLIFDEVGLLRLEAAIIEYNPALVTIDPLFAYPGAKMDIHRANECRRRNRETCGNC